MKKILFMAFLLVSAAGVWAQTTTISDNNARVRQVGTFTGVKVSAGIELLLQQGDKDAVAVSCSNPEYLDRIKTTVEGNVLKISIENLSNGSWSWRKNVKFKAYVSIRQLEKLSASSGSTVRTGAAIQVNALDLDVSSGAVVEAEFKGQSIKSDNSSGSVVTLRGSVENLEVEASSGAVFKGYEISSVNCTADASSGGTISVTVTRELNAEASSGGEIKYKGGGVIRKIHTSSGGSVRSNG